MIRLRAFLPLAFLSLTLAGTASADEAQAQAFVEREHGNIRGLVEKKAADADVKKAIDAMVDCASWVLASNARVSALTGNPA